MTLGNMVIQSAGVSNPKKNGYVRFERGPESMFWHVMIKDASGNLLEIFENYREGPGTFHGEGLVLPGYDTPVWV